MSEGQGQAPDMSSVEAAQLEELADLSKTDPALYAQVVSEAVDAVEREEQSRALLDVFENADTRRQEQDRALLDLVFRAPGP